MGTLIGELRYALRQFWVARVFTATAVLTLALGIGGTTAIFTLMHAVMVRSLPVGDPSRLYRIGDGGACCVQGSPQDRWGMFSFPLFERLRAEMPEFEEVTAFQAGGARISVRRQDVDTASRPLRSEFVTGNYFSALGVGAFGGRVFTAADDTPSAPPAVVMSHHVWQSAYGGDPKIIGTTLFIEGHPFTVVGVTPAGFFGETLRADPPDLWSFEAQSHFVRGLLLVTNTPPGALEPQVTRALAEADPNLTVTSVRTLQQQVDRSFDQQRAVASLAGLFGIVALVLAAIGLYGVTAYTVAQRTNEIGLRMALGANRGTVVGMVLHVAFRRVVIGLALGVPLAVGAGRLLSAQLYGIRFWDPLALGVAAMSLAACTFVAAIIPAARAASISPMNALRAE